MSVCVFVRVRVCVCVLMIESRKPIVKRTVDIVRCLWQVYLNRQKFNVKIANGKTISRNYNREFDKSNIDYYYCSGFQKLTYIRVIYQCEPDC